MSLSLCGKEDFIPLREDETRKYLKILHYKRMFRLLEDIAFKMESLSRQVIIVVVECGLLL